MTPTVGSDEQNKPGGSVVRSRSNFDLNQTKFDTYRFAEVKPVFVLDGVPNDKNIRLHSGHDARSLTLSSILMENVNLHKAHFAIPMEAILPLNWNKWFENPVIGEDVPDDAGCGVSSFRTKYRDFLYNITDIIENADTPIQRFSAFLYFLKYCSFVYSDGSLLASLDAHFSNCFSIHDNISDDGDDLSFDEYFDKIISTLNLNNWSANIVVGNLSLFVASPSQIKSPSFYKGSYFKAVSWREFFYDYFDESINIRNLKINGVEIIDGSIVTSLATLGDSAFDDLIFYPADDDDMPLNISRLWAYQLVCAHFFTNDKVDYIYSAELFRQLIGNYIFNELGFLNFNVNGISYEYDYLSARYFNEFLNSYFTDAFAYFEALFDFKHSLKFMDYFTGGRTKPLAVGDVTVNTSSGSVNVVDLAQTSWRAKFLQMINRFGNKAKNYIEGVFGVEQKYDYHDPMFLGKTTDVIYSSETENTGSDQFSLQSSVTSVFRSNADRFAFDIDLDRNTILLSVVYFDIKRAYPAYVDRNFFVLDRNDMFNPYTQFFGDQSIYRTELDGSNSYLNFGYTNRDMQYKIKVDVASGGFVRYLPGWSFKADSNSYTSLTPRFIRSQCSELDQFFLKLTNDSPAGYFHFILKNENSCKASRPMAFNPVISF